MAAIWSAVIAGGSTVASQMLANKNKQTPKVSGAVTGQTSQMKPLGTAISGAPNVKNANPAFGQFLQGRF